MPPRRSQRSLPVCDLPEGPGELVMIRTCDGGWEVTEAPETVRLPFALLGHPERSDMGIEVIGLVVHLGFPATVRYRIHEWESASDSIVCQRL